MKMFFKIIIRILLPIVALVAVLIYTGIWEQAVSGIGWAFLLAFTSAVAILTAALVGTRKGWRWGLALFIAIETLILFSPRIARHLWDALKIIPWGDAGLYAGIALGAIALGILVWYAFKKGTSGSAAIQLPKGAGRNLIILCAIVFVVVALMNWLGTGAGRPIWDEIQDTRWWFIAGIALGAIVLAFIKGGWAKFAGVAILFIAFNTALTEVRHKAAADMRVTLQTQAEAARQYADSIPPTQKSWRIGFQRHDCKKKEPLKSFAYYTDVSVEELDADSVKMTMVYPDEQGLPHVMHFTWGRRTGVPLGTWRLENSATSGQFKIWQVAGVDKYAGEYHAEGMILAMTLEGRAPSGR